ncbi:MAG: hypothetical protein JHC38_09000 [Thiotrichales bacterium]|jgi:hypothetical protein|nr:hypothetical protein [Thiotrichales bacterium]
MSRHSTYLWLLTLLLTIHVPSFAADLAVGDRVWIDMPAANINDDAYGEGKITAFVDQKTTRVFVQAITTSKAFSSGASCTPTMDERAAWQTPEVLRNQETKTFLNAQLMPWTVGYNRYYERQNWLHSFLKWKDHHPVIERSQLVEDQRIAQSRGMNDLAAVSALILMDYDSNQGENFHIYPLIERVPRTSKLLAEIQTIFKQHPSLKALWFSPSRDTNELNKNSYTFFMIQAIDKVVEDAQSNRRLLSKDFNDHPEVKALDTLLTQFKRS